MNSWQVATSFGWYRGHGTREHGKASFAPLVCCGSQASPGSRIAFDDLNSGFNAVARVALPVSIQVGLTATFLSMLSGVVGDQISHRSPCGSRVKILGSFGLPYVALHLACWCTKPRPYLWKLPALFWLLSLLTTALSGVNLTGSRTVAHVQVVV